MCYVNNISIVKGTLVHSLYIDDKNDTNICVNVYVRVNTHVPPCKYSMHLNILSEI